MSPPTLAARMDGRAAMRLGRVSNLPTVWTNALAAVAISGGALGPGGWATLLAALSLFYVGGMFLNDAFDAEIDARERADRPIPRGEARRGTVYALGFGMLGLGVALGFTFPPATGLAGVGLAAAILLYDALHKRTVLSPVLMGSCRLLVYVTAASAAGGSTGLPFWAGALGLAAYVIGLTYAAKQEAYDRIGAAWPLAVLGLPVVYAAARVPHDPWVGPFWLALVAWMAHALRLLFRRRKGDVPRAVVGLIAGVSLYDAVLVAGAGHLPSAALCLAGFAATLALQRLAPGT